MRLFYLLAAIALVGCVGVTDVIHDREHCFFPGDTATLTPVILAPDSLIVECRWGIVETEHCFAVPVTRYTRSDCVEGAKWKP